MPRASTQSTVVVAAILTVGCSLYGQPPERFREEILETVNAVTAWQIEYETVVAEDAPRGETINHRIIAMREPNSVFHLSSKFGHKTGATWREFPMQQLSITSNKREYWGMPRRRTFRVLTVDNKELFPGSLPREFFWYAITWWPISRESNFRLGNGPITVVDVLEAEEYQFLDGEQIVNGVPCYSLKSPGKGILWFDARRTGVLLARDFYINKSEHIDWRLELSEHKEIKPGVWCPFRIRNIHFDVNAVTEEGRKRKVNDSVVKIVKARVNDDVPQGLFDFPAVLPGAIQSFEDGTFKQIEPGGEDYQDEIIAWIERRTGDRKERSNQWTMEFFSYLAVLLISGMVIWSRLNVRRVARDRVRENQLHR